MKRLALLLSMAACAPIPLDGSFFERRTEGRSFDVAVLGEEPYGAITFLSGRRVLWDRDETGLCYAGTWTQRSDGQVCFAYQNPTREVCWRYEIDISGAITMQVDGDDRAYLYSPLPAAAPCSPNA